MFRSSINIKIFLIFLIFITAVLANNITLEIIGRPKFILEYMLIFIGILSLFSIIYKREIPLIPSYVLFLLAISTIAASINSIVLDDLRPLKTFLVTNIAIVSIYLLFSDNKLLSKGNLITQGLILISAVIILLSLIFEPFTLFRYQGILDDSNSMGRVSGYIFLISFSYFLFFKKPTSHNFILITLLIATFVVLLATNNRTPLFISILFIFISNFVYNSRGLKNIFRFIRPKLHTYLIIILILFSGLYLVNKYVESGTPIFSSLYENFVYQFERFPGTYGTSNRTFRWTQAINEYYNFFGSNDYAEKSFSKLEVHNNYISQVLKFGLIPSICFHLLPFIIFFKSFSRIVVRDSRHMIIPFSLSFYLLLYYVFETGAALAPFWIMIIYDAFITSGEKIDGQKKTDS